MSLPYEIARVMYVSNIISLDVEVWWSVVDNR